MELPATPKNTGHLSLSSTESSFLTTIAQHEAYHRTQFTTGRGKYRKSRNTALAERTPRDDFTTGGREGLVREAARRKPHGGGPREEIWTTTTKESYGPAAGLAFSPVKVKKVTTSSIITTKFSAEGLPQDKVAGELMAKSLVLDLDLQLLHCKKLEVLQSLQQVDRLIKLKSGCYVSARASPKDIVRQEQSRVGERKWVDTRNVGESLR